VFHSRAGGWQRFRKTREEKMMTELTLGDSNVAEYKAQKLLDELRARKKRGTFTTRVTLTGKQRCDIVTTNERVHLDISKMTEKAQQELCLIFQRHLLVRKERQLIFGFDYHTDKPGERQWLVTAMAFNEPAYSAFHVSAVAGQVQRDHD
jgi:hypothetical protein